MPPAPSPTAAASAFASLPPDVQNAIASAAPPGAADASAAGMLALTVLSGKAPSPGQIVAGLAGVATLAGGPAIGMAMGAIGAGVVAFSDVLQSLFNALGFYAPSVSFTYQGYQRASDPKPTGPADPNWIPVSTYPEMGAVLGLKWGPHAPKLPGGRPPYSPDAATNSNPFSTYWAQSGLQTLIFHLLPPAERWSWDHGSWQGDTFMPADPSGFDPGNPTAGPSPIAGASWPAYRYDPLSPFEAFFAHVLLANMQFWANALPFIPPRVLLLAAATAWNAKVPDRGSSVTYQPGSTWTGSAPWSAGAQPTVVGGVIGGVSSSLPNNLISLVLGPMGDPAGVTPALAPLVVHLPPSGVQLGSSSSVGRDAPGARTGLANNTIALRSPGAMLWGYLVTSAAVALVAVVASVALEASFAPGRVKGDRF